MRFFEKYVRDTRKFHYSFLFAVPFLVIYEIGLYYGALGQSVNAADAFLRLIFYFIFNVLGPVISMIFLAVIIIVLLGYLFHYIKQNRVAFSLIYFLLMLAESIVLAFLVAVLVHLGLNQSLPKFFSFQPNPGVTRQLSVIGLAGFWPKIVASVGAGIFEELLFRVFLLRLFYKFWSGDINRRFGQNPLAMTKAIVTSCFIFALMHIGSVGSILGLLSIFFGAVLFSGIYIRRGYGITAATHIFYDIFLMFGVIA